MRAMHVADRNGVIHRCIGDDDDWAQPIACGGAIALPGPRVGGPPTCRWCKAGQIEPGYEQDNDR